MWESATLLGNGGGQKEEAGGALKRETDLYSKSVVSTERGGNWLILNSHGRETAKTVTLVMRERKGNALTKKK